MNTNTHTGNDKLCQPLCTKVLAEKQAPEGLGLPSGGKEKDASAQLCCQCRLLIKIEFLFCVCKHE